MLGFPGRSRNEGLRRHGRRVQAAVEGVASDCATFVTSVSPETVQDRCQARRSLATSRLIVGAMPGFCCVSSNKQQRRCNGCPVHSISKRNYEASSRNLSFLTFVSPAFVVSSVLQLSPAQNALRIPKPCDWLRKIRAHAGPDRATVARPDRGEPAPT